MFLLYKYVLICTGKPMQVSKSDFTAVVHHQGRYYAAHTNNKTIDVFEQQADQFKQIYSSSIDTTKGSFISLGTSNNLLYVSLASKIKAYAPSGAFQLTTSKFGSLTAGELIGPHICNTDASAATLIADLGNNRLQVMSAKGQWSIVPLDPPVKKQINVCLVQDTLYVSNRNENGKWLISSYEPEY